MVHQLNKENSTNVTALPPDLSSRIQCEKAVVRVTMECKVAWKDGNINNDNNDET